MAIVILKSRDGGGAGSGDPSIAPSSVQLIEGRANGQVPRSPFCGVGGLRRRGTLISLLEGLQSRKRSRCRAGHPLHEVR